MTSIEYLPSEIVDLILSRIDNINDLRQCILVNKLFYLALNRRLWCSPMDVHTSYWSYSFKLTSFLKCIKLSHDYRHRHLRPIPLGHYIRSLYFQSKDSLEDILLLVSMTPKMERLSIYNQDIGDREMEQIAIFGSELLSFHCIKLIYMTNYSMKSLGQHCHQLCKLTLNGINQLTPSIFIHLKHCPLEQLEITNCKGLITAKVGFYLASFFPKLTHLRLLQNKPGIDEAFIQHLLPSSSSSSPSDCHPWIPLPGLTVLDLQGENHRPRLDPILVPFIQSHPHLESMYLCHCRIGNDVLIAMANCLPNLKKLHIIYGDDLSPRVVKQLVKGCSRLAALYLPGCPLEFFHGIIDRVRLNELLGPNEINFIRGHIDDNELW